MKKSVCIAITMMFSAIGAYAAEYTVEMKNNGTQGVMVFEPAVVKAKVGDTVHFVPTDPGHNTETLPGLIPSASKGWKSSFGEKFSVTLDAEGVYVYQCMPHAMMAMVGVIVAGKPTNLQDVAVKASSLTSKFVVHKDRLDSYLAQVK